MNPTHPSLSSPSQVAAPTPAPAPRAGRPTLFSRHFADVLCSIIRQSGISDSGAAARASLHPSTVSRWKREFPDFAILLRSAREEFRSRQLAIVLETAQSGATGGWRAAAWLLERTFPEDYAPRARERALFQERFDAVCASEEEGGEVVLTEGEEGGELAEPAEETALPYVQNSDGTVDETQSEEGMESGTDEGRALQNVQNGSARAGAGNDARGGHGKM